MSHPCTSLGLLQHPRWRRRLSSLSLESLKRIPLLPIIVTMTSQLQPRRPQQHRCPNHRRHGAIAPGSLRRLGRGSLVAVRSQALGRGSLGRGSLGRGRVRSQAHGVGSVKNWAQGGCPQISLNPRWRRDREREPVVTRDTDLASLRAFMCMSTKRPTLTRWQWISGAKRQQFSECVVATARWPCACRLR